MSKTVSDNTGIFVLPSDNYNLRTERSISNNDQRHKVSSAISWQIKKGLRLSGGYVLNSPLPYTITTGRDDNGDTSFNDRFFGVLRNSVRGTWRNELDLSLSYSFSFVDKSSTDDGKSFAMITTSSEAATGFDFTNPKKRFSLKLYATANNILNQTNFTSFSRVQSTIFRKPISAIVAESALD